MELGVHIVEGRPRNSRVYRCGSDNGGPTHPEKGTTYHMDWSKEFSITATSPLGSHTANNRCQPQGLATSLLNDYGGRSV